ncbi:MAG: DUF1566 domain-containing protein [Candidatus Electrothrix sp. AU1_5]|nr:DUF1566 domain-containing protein [Candidatus Electrothrix gigas]
MYALRMCCVVLLALLVSSGNALAKRSKFDESSVSAINLDVVRVEACARGKGCVVAGGPMQVDLLDMAKDNIDYVNQVLLPEKTKRLRLILGDNSTITVDGEVFPLTVPSGKRSGLKLWGRRAFPKEGGFLSNLELNFNLKRQLVVKRERNWPRGSKGSKGSGKGSGKERWKGKDSVAYSYKLKPVIKVATAEVEQLPENMEAVVAMPDEETVLREGDDDLVVTIPAGAVSESTVITARKIENAFYELNPDGQKFSEPVTIAMSYRALFYKEAGYTDEDLVMLRNGVEFPSSTDIDSQTITASTKKFSYYGIAIDVADAVLSESCERTPSDEDLKSIISIMQDKLQWPLAAALMKHWFDNDGGKVIYKPSLNPAKDKLPDELEQFPLISGRFADYKTKAEKNELFNGVLEPIVKGLRKTANKDGKPVIPYGGTFNHITGELNSAGNSWHTGGWEEDNMFYVVNKPIKPDTIKDQYTAAFGNGSSRVVESGNVTVENGIAKITITQAGIYFKDSYDFFTDEQFLGCWSENYPYFSLVPQSFNLRKPLNSDYICVCNESFRNYNIRHGEDENRGNFRIFSDPKEYIVNTNQTLDDYKIPDSLVPPDPVVEKVFPKNAKQHSRTTFTIKGHDFPDQIAFSLEDCFNFKMESFDSTEIKISCEPLKLGEKKGEVRYGYNNGLLLSAFTVLVEERDPTCITGGLYCGDAITDSSLILADSLISKSKTLYKCMNGFFVEKEVCAGGCVISHQGKNDICDCPNGDLNKFYCGGTVPSLGLDSDTLYRCVDGEFSEEKKCVNGCKDNFPDDDKCNGVDLPDKCINGGLYCGSTDPTTLDSNTLYKCIDGELKEHEVCANGCKENDPGYDDECNGIDLPDTCINGGLYCGNTDSTLNSDVLYKCIDGELKEYEICVNGCDIMPAGTNDRCSSGTPPQSDGDFIFPFAERESLWQICQGYNTPTISHTGNLIHSFDIAYGSGNLGSTGCWGNPGGSEDKTVVAPAAGTIVWNGANDTDITCFRLENSVSNGHGVQIASVKLGHMKSNSARASAGQYLAQGDIVGKLCGPTGCPSAGGYAHTHIAAYTNPDCTGVSVPFGSVFGSGYNFSSNGSLYQWHGTEIPPYYVEPELPVVNSVSPNNVTLNELTTFTVTGSNLPSGLAFFIEECEDLLPLGGSSTSMQFRCTPSWTIGVKNGVVKDKTGGNILYDFTVDVSDDAPEESRTCTSGDQTTMWKGREWQRCDDGTEYTWEEAKDYCENLVLGGHSDWRLPTKDELKSLVVCTNGTPTPLSDSADEAYGCGSGNGGNDGAYDIPTIDPAFECHPELYWSSTPKEVTDTSPLASKELAWDVFFYYGYATWDPTDLHIYVRCIR